MVSPAVLTCNHDSVHGGLAESAVILGPAVSVWANTVGRA